MFILTTPSGPLSSLDSECALGHSHGRIVMKRFMFGTLMLVLVILSLTLPSINGQSLTLTYSAWSVDYTISAVNLNLGESANLYITLRANVDVYDLRLRVISTPGPLVQNNDWLIQCIDAGEQSNNTFTVQIPTTALPGTYHLDLLIQGYNDAAWLGIDLYPHYPWSCHGIFCTETPQYTQDTSKLQGSSIVLTVT